MMSAIAVGAFSMTMALAMGQGGGEYAQKLLQPILWLARYG